MEPALLTEIAPDTDTTPAPARRRDLPIQFLLLALVLLGAGYFRFTGLLWGDYQYQHPDERFLIWVVADIAPVQNVGQYFDSLASTLNPVNRGHTFYVYGDFPVVFTRYATDWFFHQVGWQEILQTGRGLSAFLDLLTVLLVYLIAERLSGWKVATLAALFSGAAVLQIQQAHFFTSDSFAVFFTTLAIYLAVLIVTARGPGSPRDAALGVLFGVAVGLALACKINTAPIALLLPVALAARWLRDASRRDWKSALRLALIAAAGGIAAFLVFRVAMPYAFRGPGFFDLALDSRWLQSLKDLRAQSAGDVDFPPALQWARRNHLFSLQNLVLWGLGLPLGVLAWIGFFVFAARAVLHLRAEKIPGLLRGSFPGALLVWGWTAVYFTWQSLAWNPTMRYQLPIYPTLAILAAWGLGSLWNHPPRVNPRAWRVGLGVTGALVALLTLAWAFAFTRIYNRTESRVAASQWIFANVPGPVNLNGTAGGRPWTQLLPVSEQVLIQPGKPYLAQFDAAQPGVLSAVNLPATRITLPGGGGLRLHAAVYDAAVSNGAPLSTGSIAAPSGGYDALQLPLDGAVALQAGHRYVLALTLDDNTGGTAGAPEQGAMVQITGQATLSLYAQVQTAAYTAQLASLSPVSLPDGGTLRQVRLSDGSSISALALILQNPRTGEQWTANATYGGAATNGGAAAAAAPLNGGAEDGGSGDSPALKIDPPLVLKPGVSYLLGISSAQPGRDLAANQPVELDFLDDPGLQYLPDAGQLARPEDPLWLMFSPQQTATITSVTLAHAVNTAAQLDPASAASSGLTLQLYDRRRPTQPLAEVRASLPAAPANDARGAGVTFTFDKPVELDHEASYAISITPDAGAVAVRGSAPANETSWDMGLPFRMDGYDPFGGLYRGDLNFEMYWDDNADKLQRFVNILDQSDYIFMSSNRQWGTTTRLPERYPLTTTYYRDLLGCPPERSVQWCYNVAEPGMFQGNLGFDLAAVFTAYPNIGPLSFNTQFAEEAFTVYDAPKVFIFKKRADYSPANTYALLSAVDLRNVVHLTPKKAAGYKDLLEPPSALTKQRAGGTWAALFPPGGLINRSPWISAVAWYVFLLALGALTYPIVRLALPGLPDRGYPLARISGLVLLAYAAWISGSLGVAVTRPLLALIFGLIAAAGIVLGYLQRHELRAEWREKRRYFFTVEMLALALFAIDLLIRLGNPDLWHPIFGGEKPMDFSYFNAVLKSSVFPPYDPWFAGGYINYYYYGFVLVGMPVKLLGINPSVAYNLILPALFSMVGLGAFSVGWNLIKSSAGRVRISPLFAAGAAVLALLILGNLGTVRMYWQGLQKLEVPEEQMNQGTLPQHFAWAAGGLGKIISGEATALPYYPGDWYWKPSRAIQPESGQEITEFPMFTFLYADLHAHLIALPVTILVIAWALAVILGAGAWGLADGRLRWLSFGLALLLGALAAGALRPANTWDQYTYLTLAALALFYAQWRYAQRRYAQRRGNTAPREVPEQGIPEDGTPFVPVTAAAGAIIYPAAEIPARRGLSLAAIRENRWVSSLVPVIVLVGLAVLLYKPFDTWFAQGYNSLTPWKGATTAVSSYLVHWGLFLFVIAAWLFQESVDWMAATPLRALNTLRPYRDTLLFGAGALLVTLLVLTFIGVHIALIAGLVGAWAAVLLFRPGQPAAKRGVLFMVGTAMALTLAVELVAVKGDIGRMNTVFKFYFQAWTLLSLSAAAALAWLWGSLPEWRPGWRNAWVTGLAVLVFGAALFPLIATRAKLADRMDPSAPHSLDGMAYLTTAKYTDGPDNGPSREMDLSQDYRAIQWVRANISGSPVIVEANTPEYRHWGTRFTIYTGLPGVVGWNWHQRQQRTVTPDTWVFNRIDDIAAFYSTTSLPQASEFLRRYNVRYIIVGQLERIYYPGAGIAKFAAQDGALWQKVYQEGETVIYQVK